MFVKRKNKVIHVILLIVTVHLHIWLISNGATVKELRAKPFLTREAKEVKLTLPSEDVIIFAARDDTIRLLSLNEKGGISPISPVPVVCEYEELPGMPPNRAVEFVIEFEPGTKPVYKRPYKLGPEELKELMRF